jgi:hypothetical protein
MREKTKPPVRTFWSRRRLGVWAVVLSVQSTMVQLKYFMVVEGGGPILSAVLAGAVLFRLPFLLFIFFRLNITPDPEPDGAEFFPGLGGRSIAVQTFAILGLLWQAMWFCSFFAEWIWIGVITSLFWMVWIYGMTVREQALCRQLNDYRKSVLASIEPPSGD